MPISILDPISSYRIQAATGAVTGVSAAQPIFSFRSAIPNATNGRAVLIRAVEVNGIVTTAFTAAQEVGIDGGVVRGATAAATGGTAVTAFVRKRGDQPVSLLSTLGDVMIANTGALTTTGTLEGTMVRASFWASGAGASLANPVRMELAMNDPGGVLLRFQDAFVLYNTQALGAAGVVRYQIAIDWTEVLIAQ